MVVMVVVGVRRTHPTTTITSPGGVSERGGQTRKGLTDDSTLYDTLKTI